MIGTYGYVLIIGSSNMDLNIYLKRFPKPGETVTGGVFKQFLGGKGANQSIASVRSGAKTVFVGKIGKDLFGEQMISRFISEGVNTDHIFRDPQQPSGIAFILINENGENMISVAPGANIKLTPQEVRSKVNLIKNATSLVVQMEIPIETIEEIFNIASEGNVIKILNPAPLKKLPPHLFKKIDIIIPNEGELYRLCSQLGFKTLKKGGKQKIVQASKEIGNFGINYIITTLGAKGCIVYNKQEEKFYEIPTLKVKAIDTVGAGDCFIGVLASFLCQGKNVLEAVKYATIAASIAVTRKGAQESIPFLNEIKDRFKELKISTD